MKLNKNFDKIKDSYLFADIADKAAAYMKEHPDAKLIKLGIGDVTIPLCPAVIQAGVKAVEEMGRAESFRGYGPYEGYEFLRSAVKNYYGLRGVNLGMDEIFISDGAKSDIGNIVDLFSEDNVVLVPDPVYPVYVDTNLMSGRKIIYADATEKNGFLPMPDGKIDCDIIYMCSPNNPTGAVYDKTGLKAWVDYAKSKNAIILFDSAYEFYVTDKSLPRSVYEVDGADEVAVEFCSLSKTAGFTGTRCGYTVIPKKLGQLNRMWLRRQSTKYNGVPYIVQRMAEAVFSEEGQRQISANVGKYMKNARLISDTLNELGIWHTGGVNSPYIWLKCPGGDSWAFFDKLLTEANVVGTPGAGFGKNGEGFFRLTAFNNYENTAEAMRRVKKALAKA
ncbi:MAG: LL-diaminopimelate aminotransferase [Christensenellales bacterium]